MLTYGEHTTGCGVGLLTLTIGYWQINTEQINNNSSISGFAKICLQLPNQY